MRRLLPLLLALMPLAAAGQVLDGGNLQRGWGTGSIPAELRPMGPDAIQLWRGNEGQSLVLTVDDPALAPGQLAATPMSVLGADAAGVTASNLRYGLDPHLQLHAGVSSHSWVHPRAPRVVGSEVGATYLSGRYSLDLSVGATSTTRPGLPRVLPGAAPGINGLSGFGSSAQVNASGRLALGSESGIDLGASMGRIHMLPGNLLGVDALDQKALSFGVDRGPLSGTLVGRTMQPALPGTLSADRRWNSIDLGVTWRLPWQGELSIGAQNLWSSGASVNTPAGPEPDQSRTPYVQYHQDL